MRFCTRPAYLRLFISDLGRRRGLAMTVFRILIAYRIGCMRYGIFVADKPAG